MGETEVPVEVPDVRDDDGPTSWNPIKVFFLILVRPATSHSL